jgi:hypothetical protein
MLPLALLAVGCGGGEKKTEAPPQKAPEPVAYFHVDPATAASVHGKIVYHGPKMPRTLISMQSDPACDKANAGRKVYDEPLIVAPDGGVANVFVYIKSGLEGKKFEPPTEQVMLDQHGCTFVPRVVGVQTAQIVDIRNSDPVEHNIHPTPKNNRAWNEGMSPGAPDLKRHFARPEVMIRVKCNVHSWMRSYVGVMDHPYFAVTGTDGSFELKNLPPGNYTVGIWHEKLGEMEQPVNVAASASQTLPFTYANLTNQH